MFNELHRTDASSLTSCGLFPVFSNCSITPVTTSSLIPCVSIRTSHDGTGDGGGVSSYLMVDFDRCSILTCGTGGCAIENDDNVDDDALCDRLSFFDGGRSVIAGLVDVVAVAAMTAGGERLDWRARELAGK